MIIPFNTYQVTIWGKEKAVCCSLRALVSLPFLLRLWLTCLKFKFSPLSNGHWMGLQWNWLSRYMYFNWGLLFFQYGSWCWKKSKKNLPSLNWPHFLESFLLNFAEQAIWQSRSRGAHDEGELQADLKDWNLLLSKQTGENGAEVNRGSDCLSSSTLPHRPKEMLHLASWQNCSPYETSSWTCEHGSWKRRATLSAWKWSRLQ